ncbi:hypothetical protein OGAPHI_004301 [Ogataea philodendri]|uniref:Uncharacterized protein n=2 Tax=Saccharomycotina TaxID=147537 RepID=A0A9P8P6D1_9ASCO|nr:uncharacterized protein OGAPHI_004301 [Ogataea philodendri]KAH3666112.1 hypothetical protein OGAPHI_004301 [Ogataea philodendri]
MFQGLEVMDAERRSKVQKYYHFIQSSVKRLQFVTEETEGQEIKEIISELLLVVPKYGINLDQFNILLDIVLDTTNSKRFTNATKSRMVKLWACYDLFDFDIFLKIIGSFRLSTFSNEGKTLHQKVQSSLSKWLVSNFANFELDKNYLRVLPFLFNMLPIGYIRADICTIITYLLQKSSEIDEHYNFKYFLNISKLGFLVDLYHKDKDVISLVLVIHSYLEADDNLPAFDTYRYKLSEIIENEKVTKHPFRYDIKAFTSLLELKTQHFQFILGATSLAQLLQRDQFHTYYSNMQSLGQMIDFLNDQYANSGSGSRHKRRKLDDITFDYSTIDILGPGAKTTCYTIETYVKNLDTVRIPQQIGVLLYQLDEFSNHKEQSQLAAFATPNQHPGFGTKIPLYNALLQVDNRQLNSWIELILKDDEQTLKSEYEPMFNGLLQLCRHSLTLISVIERLITKDLTLSNDNLEIVKFYEFFSYLNYHPWSEFKQTYERIGVLFRDPEAFSRVVESLGNLIDNWQLKLIDAEDYEFWKTVNNLLENIIWDFSRLYCGQPESHLECKLAFVQFLSLMYRIEHRHLKLSVLVLPPAVLYDLYFSTNAILVDAMCYHVTFCKTYYANYLSTQPDHGPINSDLSHTTLSMLKNLHNSYVMDLCNILWRDKAFDKNEKSTAKGFMLPTEFSTKLLKQRYHNYDSSMSQSEDYDFDAMKRDFNVFYAPAYASLITNIIRRLEDKAGTEVRLAGPLNETEFGRLINGTGRWFDPELEYDYLRLDILDELAVDGLGGLRSLLHSSLKSLAIKLAERAR